MRDVGKCDRDTILRILDRARWAPSGDNTQPWRFEIVADDQVIVHGHDTRDEVLYDFDGHPSHMAHGALLETMRIAASAEGFAMAWRAEADDEWRHIRYFVTLRADPDIQPDPLHSCIELRTVQRRPMRMTPLTDAQRQAILAAPGEGYTIQLFESFAQRRQIAKLLWDSAYIRLTCPEAYEVHKNIIEWGAQFSEDRIPEKAVGVDPLTAKLMRWVMGSWGRVDFFNRYLMGTVLPRVQLDYLPALMCAGHICLAPDHNAESLEDWVKLGAAMQRLWLTVTAQGLNLQPEMTPVIFGWYAKSRRVLSADQGLAFRVARVFEVLVALRCGAPTSTMAFFARVGNGAAPEARSVRISLQRLLQN